MDCLALGVKYYLDAFGISAQERVITRKREEWQDLLDAFVDDPQTATNHLAMGMSLEQRRSARGFSKGGVARWI